MASCACAPLLRIRDCEVARPAVRCLERLAFRPAGSRRVGGRHDDLQAPDDLRSRGLVAAGLP